MFCRRNSDTASVLILIVRLYRNVEASRPQKKKAPKLTALSENAVKLNGKACSNVINLMTSAMSPHLPEVMIGDGYIMSSIDRSVVCVDRLETGDLVF